MNRISPPDIAPENLPPGWRRDGSGAKGPCPLCNGGGRRAWVRPYPERIAAGCPSCNARASRLLAALGIAAAAAQRAGVLERNHRRVRARRAGGDHVSIAAGFAWGLAGDNGGLTTRTRRYLEHRIGGWPGDREWPASIRELRPHQLHAWERGARTSWPLDQRPDGIVLYLWRAPGDAGLALQAEAYRGLERIHHHPAGGACKRWTIGKTSGRAFVIEPRGRNEPECTWITEGPSTALAVAADHPHARVVAAGGQLDHAVPHVRLWIGRYGRIRLATEAAAPATNVLKLLRALYGPERVAQPWAPAAGSPRGTDYEDERRRVGRRQPVPPVRARP